MIKLHIKNLDLVENEQIRDYVKNYTEQRISLFSKYLKRYPKDVTLEITIHKKPSGWKVDAYIEMISETLYFEESGKNIKDVFSAIFKSMKNQIKKQKAIERKDYEYKRSKYRKKLLSQKSFEKLINLKKTKQRNEFDKELEGVYNDLQLDLSERFQNKGISKEQADNIAKILMEKIKNEVYETFDSEKDEREDFLDSISDISNYFEKNYNQDNN